MQEYQNRRLVESQFDIIIEHENGQLPDIPGIINLFRKLTLTEP